MQKNAIDFKIYYHLVAKAAENILTRAAALPRSGTSHILADDYFHAMTNYRNGYHDDASAEVRSAEVSADARLFHNSEEQRASFTAAYCNAGLRLDDIAPSCIINEQYLRH